MGVPILAKRQSSRADIQTARTQAALDHSATAAAGRIAAHRFGQLVEELGMTVLETPTGEAVDGPRQVWEHPVDRLAASVPQEADGGVREEVGMDVTGTPMGELVEGMRQIWEHSVDELDSSVSLEADGVNDTVAANRYGVRDVADLAEQLTMLVPARVPAEAPDELGKPIPYLRLACRGLLFAVPGLFYLVVARADPSPTASYTMIIAMLAGWGLSQAVAVVGYRILGRAGAATAALALRRILTWSLGAAALALAIATVLQWLSLAGMATGQILYVLAATVLLFYSADRLLALALTPGALVSAAYLAHLPVPSIVALAAAAATVAAAWAAGWYRANLGVAGQSPTGRLMLSDLRASGPFVLEGLLSGIAVAYIPLRMLDGNMGANVHYLDLSIVPLVLSMGFAEIELLRLKAAGGRLMRHTVHLADYQRGASRLLVLSQLRFLLVLVTVSVPITVLISMTSGFNTRDLTLLSAYSTLGTALLAALVLVAVDRVRVALLGFWFAGCAIAVVLGASRLTGLTLSVEGGYLAGCLILFGFLTALAVRTLRDPRALA